MRRFASALALVVVAGILVACGSDGGDGEGADADGSTTTATAPTDGPGPETTPGSMDAPLPLGRPTTVGDWEVALVDYRPDAAAELATTAPGAASTSPRNGRWALVRVFVTYNGEGQVAPGDALDFALIDRSDGGNQVSSFGAGCLGLDDRVPTALGAVPLLPTGGTGQGNVCFDVSPEAADDGLLAASDPQSGDDATAYWKP